MPIRFVFFDALHTIVKPRLPIHIQYTQVFAPYFTVEPSRVKEAFKIAIKEVQVERPAYGSQDAQSIQKVEDWWGEVIRRTAVGAGADKQVVDGALNEIVPTLLHRFSSREGYALYEDTIPTLQDLHSKGIRTGLISNTDVRMRLALEDLGVLQMLSPTLFSEEEGVEKPSPEMWRRALERANLPASEVLHVGDEIEADYRGAREAGLQALLLQRPEETEQVQEVERDNIIASLTEIPAHIS